MSTRRIFGGALALLAVAGAALLIVLARGVSAVDDQVVALRAPASRAVLTHDPDAPVFGLADRVARTLLSAEDELEFRRALGFIEESRRLAHLPNQVLELHAQAIAVLQRIDDHPPERASRAAAVIGALNAEDQVIDSDAASRYRQQATEAFQTAVRLDPMNEAAKLGLELVLSGSAGIVLSAADEGPGSGITGAGESVPGTGY